MSQERDGAASTDDQPRDGSLQAHSCILCKQRKVKCDKRYPCAACTRAKVQCLFRAPAPPRRGKRRPNEMSLLARLKRYEDTLQSLGVSIENVRIDEAPGTVKDNDGSNGLRTLPPFGTSSSTDQQVNVEGKLVSDEGKSMYFDNILWKSLSDALPEANEVLQSSDEEGAEDDVANVDASPESSHDLVFSLSGSTSIRIPHPLPSQIIRLWQIFVDAVNPLCKLLHEPTTYNSIIAATADLTNVPRHLEALLYSIYTISIYVMEPRECEDLFAGEKRSVLLARYQLATRLALQKAGLLKSTEMTTLQAFIIYLFSVRSTMDPRVLWIYTGMAVRIAQRIGMHRDGSRLSISPFETEIRRRVWWQVVVLDAHASQLSGSGASLSSDSWDSLIPLNINDADIWPEMTEPPKEREDATEMFFCMVRFEFGRVFRPNGFNAVEGTRLWTGQAALFRLSVEERDKMIDEAEKSISDKWLRFADPFNDIHILTLGVARTALASMRLMVHHPRQYPDGGASLSQEERDLLFNNALKIVEYDRNVHVSSTMRRFRWHVTAFFQLNSFVYILNSLQHRLDGKQVVSAWKLVEEVYTNHPELVNGQKRTVTLALTNLTLTAWSKFEAGKQITRPPFINAMLARKLAFSQKGRSTESAPSSSSVPSPAQTSQSAMGPQVKARMGQYVTPSQTGSTPSSGPGTAATQAETPYGGYQGEGDGYSTASGTLYGEPASADINMESDIPADFALANEGPAMDWAAWDSLIQDSVLEGFDDPAFALNFNA